MRTATTPEGNAMLQLQPVVPPRSRRLERPLLASCAIGLALVAAARAPEARAQGFQGTGVVAGGSATITTPTATQTDIAINSDRAVINWTPTDTAIGGPAIDFLPAGSTASFSRVGQDFTVLNRIVPTDVTRGIALNGAVLSSTSGSVPNSVGNVWFYSPGGIAIGASATFDVGSLLLSTLDVADADFLDTSDSSYNFGFNPATVIATSAITIAPGATINTPNENSYVAMIAPRVVQGGRVDVNGTATYVAAEQTTINMSSGLFAIDITAGTTDANGIVHSGNTTGPASTGAGDVHAIRMVAVPRNSAITMLVGGNLGYAAAGAGVVNGVIELYAGYDLPDGTTPTADNGGFAADIIVSRPVSGFVSVSSDLLARASRDVSLISDGLGGFFSGANVSLIADRDAILTANRDMTVSGNLTLVARNRASATLGAESGYGGTLSVGGDMLIDASATGAAGGGTGTGGIAELILPTGSLSVTGTLNILANGIGGLGGGDGAGGTARFSMTGGTADLGDVVIRADGFGNGDTNAPVLNAGDGRGGLAEFTHTGGDLLPAPTSMTLSANGVGGTNDVSLPGGSGGAGAGGTVRFTGAATRTEITNFLDLSAQGIGGAGTATGGSATSGDALVQVTGVTALGFLTTDISATGGTAEPGGIDGAAIGTGHAARIAVNGIGARLDTGGLVVDANASVNAGGANGGNIAAGNIEIIAQGGGTVAVSAFTQMLAEAGSSSSAERTGTAQGGNITVSATGGDVRFQGSALLSVEARSGSGTVSSGVATGGNVTLSASAGGTLQSGDFAEVHANAFGGSAPVGTNAFGGTILAFAEDGALDLGSSTLFSATGSAGFNTSGSNPATGTGGTITIESRATAANLSTITTGSLRAFAEGFGVDDGDGFTPSSGDAGIGVGGNVAVNVLGGSFTAASLRLDADALGGLAESTASGPASTGGDAIAGNVTFTLSGGTATIDQLSLTATGRGGDVSSSSNNAVGGLAGAGTGGTARIDATGGTLTSISVEVVADGIGGDGAFSTNGIASAGGVGQGGTARINLGAGSSISTSDLIVAASGLGGYGGDTVDSTAGAGGTGTGGAAAIEILGGTLTASFVEILADGEGGFGGLSQGIGATGTGGIGRGGSARLHSKGDFFTIDDLAIGARGLGGRGGDEFGYGTGSGGGDGGNGFGGGATLDLDYDPVIANLSIDASGAGGAGGNGVIGGNGGDGFGGINTAGTGGANLNLSAGALTVNNAIVRSDGTGGNGGSGSAGNGGNGGSGTGGDALITVTGAGAVLTLSPDSATQATTLSANGLGGRGGFGTTPSTGVGAAGGNGGNGSGGSVRFDILAGGQVLAGPSVMIAANGIGGHGMPGTSGATGGAGGNGGIGAGGSALLNIDGGTLLAFDPAISLDWSVTANGVGGGIDATGGNGTNPGNSGGAGGSGGAGRGGVAQIAANNARYELGIVTLGATGIGGHGSPGGNGAATGNGGDGVGGTARFSNSDDGVTPLAGSRSITTLTMRANGRSGLAAGVPNGLNLAGRVEIVDTARVAGGSVMFDSLSVINGGFTNTNSGFFLTSTGGPIAIAGTASVNTGGPATFSFDGSGRLAVGGTLSVNAQGDITITHANQPGTPVDSISAATISFGTPGSFSADAASVLRSGSSINLFTGGNIGAGNLFALDRITAQAGGNITLGNAAVTGAVSPPLGGAPTNGVIDLAAGVDSLSGSTSFVPADITLTGNISATGHIVAQAGRDIIVASGANVISDNRITFRSGDDILVRSGALVRAAANPLPEFGYGVSGPLDEPALLDFNAGAIAVTPVDPTNVAAIIVDGTIGAPNRAVTLTAGAIQADANAIAGQNFYANLRGVPVTGAPANNDGGQLRTDCVAGNICLGALGASNVVRIGPGSGTVDVPARVSVAGNINATDVVIRARDALAFNGPATIHGTDRLFLAVLNGDLTGNGAFALSGGNLVNVYASGSIIAPQGSISAAGNLGLGASGGVDLATIRAGGLLQQIDGNGGVTQADGLTLGGAFRAGTLLSVGGGNLRVTAPGGIAIGTLQVANGNALLQASNGAVSVSTDVATAGGVTANGQSVTLTAIGDLNVTDALASAGAITLTSTTGNLSLGAANAGTAFTANARGTASFNGQVAAQIITVNSGDIAIGAGGQLGVIGRTTGVAITNSDATRQTYIGGADTSAGYSLSAVEIGRIFGDSIGVTAPRVSTLSPTSVGSTRAPDVIVGAFTLTGRAGGAGGNLGSGALSITTPGKLRVTGAVQLTGLTAANRLSISATDALEIDAASGSIDLRDASGGLGGVLQLSSDDIIAASLQAIADVGSASTTDAIDDRLAINDGAVDDDGYFSANRIEVTARNGFYVQNSGATDEFADRRGFTVGTGGMAITTGSATTRIVINGRQSDGAGSFTTGTDMIGLVSINGRTGLSVSGIDRRSTINGCLIANPLCSGFVVPGTLLSREVFEAPVDPESAEEALQQLFPLTLIELKEFEPFGFEPLIDEPVTGAGNDDLWMPECDPSIEQCEAPPRP
ncbi:hypothetical protein [Sphingomonas sp. LaA6.9]|uniref:hypothetical protein n=1 Tax=Sphingomonas sp. LaA6.9 TaxID=2919914 RepID=UPI001F4F3B35|nr:hypothetical protein [Sphingomonas sp. LaA6.9]MCJ8155893.1 hypothetical protein [Sphingomonas sp. LaA6.9]